MKKEHGWWFPDRERHLQEWMTTVGYEVDGRLTYQRHKYERALKYCERRGLAVDVGGHIGLWSWQMARDFTSVYAFEPMPEHRDCWVRNLDGYGNAFLRPDALGEGPGIAHIRTRTDDSSGDTGVEPDGDGVAVQMSTLDSYSFAPDFLKLDCEGYELFVLRGGVETLERHRPVVVVEQKPETGMCERYGIGATDGVEFLKGLGAKVREEVQGDYIMSWDE